MSSIFNYFVFGSNGDDVLVGAADHEQVLFGFAGNDLIEAGGQSDFVLAGRGDDIVIGGAGDETILGGAGYDVSVYEGSISDYDIQSYDWGAVTVTSIGAVSDAGSDTLFDAEALYFAADDVTIFLDGTNNVPIAKDDAVTLGEAGGKIPVATLLANDMDFDGDALTVTGVTATSSMGVAVSLLNGEVIYSPGAKFDGLTPG